MIFPLLLLSHKFVAFHKLFYVDVLPANGDLFCSIGGAEGDTDIVLRQAFWHVESCGDPWGLWWDVWIKSVGKSVSM